MGNWKNLLGRKLGKKKTWYNRVLRLSQCNLPKAYQNFKRKTKMSKSATNQPYFPDSTKFLRKVIKKWSYNRPKSSSAVGTQLLKHSNQPKKSLSKSHHLASQHLSASQDRKSFTASCTSLKSLTKLKTIIKKTPPFRCPLNKDKPKTHVIWS